MDQNGKGEEMVVNEEIISNTASDRHKSCVDCMTTKTPLWRSGPSGPKSLCNACGIRYRKKRAERPTRDSEKDEIGTETSYKKRKVSQELRSRVMALGKEVVVLQQQQQPRTPVKRRRRSSNNKCNNHYWKKMGEVEQAAALLMALSCGSVLAQNIEREIRLRAQS